MKKRICLLLMMVLLVACVLSLSACLGGGDDFPPETYYDVLFDSQGGGIVESIFDVPENTTVSAPAPAPAKSGYTLSGWCRDEAGKTEWVFSRDKVTGDMTLYAKWTAVEYAITYENLLNGTNPNTLTKYTIESPAITFDAPVRVGYAGVWDIAGIPAGSTEDKTITAAWTAKEYTVDFDKQDGTGGANRVTALYAADMPAAAAPVKAGYVFGGYFEKAGGAGKQYYNSDMTSTNKWDIDAETPVILYALWNPSPNFIMFDGNGKTGGTMDSVPAQTDGQITLPACGFVRTGYTFSAWNTKSDGTGASYASGADYTMPASDESVTLYAKWIANDYTVSFDKQNGTGTDDDITVIYGEAYGVLPTVTRVGYTLSGWWTAASGGEKITQTTAVALADNHTLYARWTPDSYTVSFDGQGGEGITTNLGVIYDRAYGTLPTMTKDGYTFSGWWTAITGGEEITAITTVAITENQKLYARWTADIYTLSFDKQGGKGEADDTPATYMEAYGELPALTKDGHIFDGWWTDAVSGTKIEASTEVSVIGDHTLYARWIAASYKVSFDPSGGETGSLVTFDLNGGTGNIPAQFITQTQGVKYPANPVRSGYAFTGWTIKGTAQPFDFKSDIITSITLEAGWDELSYYTAGPYYYDSSRVLGISSGSGGADYTIVSKYPTVTVNINVISGAIYINSTGSAILRSSDGTRSYTVTGTWSQTRGAYVGSISTILSSTSGGYAEYNMSISGTGYANSAAYEASFAPAAPTGTLSEMPDEIFATYDSAYALPVARLAGYTFSGWYINKDGTDVQVTDANGKSLAPYSYITDVTVFAKWTANAYTVSFDKRNGDGTASDMTVIYDEEYGQLPVITRTGYTFAGWWTAVSGGEQITETTVVEILSNHTLYARWTANTYKITYELNGGDELEPDHFFVTYDSGYELPVPTRTGHSFLGWWDSADDSGTGYTSQSGASISNWNEDDEKTLYARWRLEQYTVTVGSNNSAIGTVYGEGTFFYDREVTVWASEISSYIYTFSGWYHNNILVSTSLTYTFNMPAENAVYVARWIVLPELSDYSFTGSGSSYTLTKYNGSASELEIPRGFNIIGANAFKDCTFLKSIVIPNSVTRIESSAFSGCSGLESITVSFVGESKTATGNNAKFGYIFGTSSYAGGVATNQNGITYYIPASLKTVIITNASSIATYAFFGCSGLTGITIPYGVTSIGSLAFYGCSGLTNVIIPDSVARIESAAFNGCSGFTNIIIPDSVTYIGTSAFYGCSGLESLTVPFVGNSRIAMDDNAKFGYIFGTSSYAGGVATNQFNITYYIPASLKTVIVTDAESIGSSVFYGCSGLTSITIPSSVASIGSSAFHGCSGLTSITVPFVGESRTTTGNNAKFGYIFGTSSYAGGVATNQNGITYYIPASLKTVIVTDATSLSSYAFYGCSGLTSITLPSGVTSIAANTFSGCSGLISITIPIGVTSIASSAFSGCSALNAVFYGGADNAAWDSITGELSNTPLTDATCYYYSATEPLDDGNYWYYADGVPTVWI